MKEIRAIIVEDEENGRASLRRMLEKFCEGVSVVAEATNVQQAVSAIEQEDPDLVFLDIEMPKQSGLELLTYFEHPRFKVIFTTAYSQYAIKAIRMAALDYLLKPIDLTELRGAIERLRMMLQQDEPENLQYGLMRQNLLGKEPRKIALANQDGYEFVNIDDIIRCEAEGSYTAFIINGRKAKVVVSRNLKEHTDLLEEFGFVRVHRSHLINKKYIKSLMRTKTPTVIMEDNTQIPIVSAKKDDLFKDIIGSMG